MVKIVSFFIVGLMKRQNGGKDFSRKARDEMLRNARVFNALPDCFSEGFRAANVRAMAFGMDFALLSNINSPVIFCIDVTEPNYSYACIAKTCTGVDAFPSLLNDGAALL